MRANLAENLALRGQYAAAVREAKLAVDLAAKDACSGPAKLYDLANVYALTGREDEAIDLLARLLRTVYEGSLTTETLKNAPEWDPLRENPRFQELLAADNI
jgi:serine/threonine-protein kinase